MTDLPSLELFNSLYFRQDLLAFGYSDREITRLVRRRTWHRVRRGAYVPESTWAELDPVARHSLRARAVLRQARTDVVLSHVSALPEYGAPTWALDLSHVHLTRSDRRTGRKEAGVSQHRSRLLAEDSVSLRGVKVTDPTRSAIDITTVTTVEPALAVVNYLLHKNLTTHAKIATRYASMQQDPFTLSSNVVFRLADSRIESVGESRLWYVFYRQSLPRPEPQFAIEEAGCEVARLDFGLPNFGCWVEFDGVQKYVKFLREDETAIDVVLREKHREDRIRELTGWRCLRVTWVDLHDPIRLAARIRTFLRAGRMAA